MNYNFNRLINGEYGKLNMLYTYRIVLDHLVPLKKNQEGFNQFYVPDGSYDCFLYKNGKWIFKEDVDVRTNKSIPKIDKEKNERELFKK